MTSSDHRLSEIESCKLFRELISAVDYLHDIGCAHRDIKPSNILIDEDKNLKLIDFGLGNLYSEEEKLKTSCGSPCYAAPEVFYQVLKTDHQRRALRSYNGRCLEQRHNPLCNAVWFSSVRRRQQVAPIQEDPVVRLFYSEVRLTRRIGPDPQNPGPEHKLEVHHRPNQGASLV